MRNDGPYVVRSRPTPLMVIDVALTRNHIVPGLLHRSWLSLSSSTLESLMPNQVAQSLVCSTSGLFVPTRNAVHSSEGATSRT